MDRPRILITNDDGIYSEGIKGLSSWAKKLGDIVVVAPEREQSGKSHSIDIHNPIRVKKIDFGGFEAYSFDSTPADCVRFAFDKLGTFDYVFSGVNRGYNVGEDIPYSGTCGAVFEANNYFSVAIAFSTYDKSFSPAFDYFDTAWEFMERSGMIERGRIWNINFPPSPVAIKVTRVGGAFFRDKFNLKESGLYKAEGYMAYEKSNEDFNFDTDSVMSYNTISISPLTAYPIDKALYNQYSGLKEQI